MPQRFFTEKEAFTAHTYFSKVIYNNEKIR